jgi:hypothetical protein
LEELNLYPNYLYVYTLQLISFQLFGFVQLILFYAKNKKMTTTLYNALTE